MFENIIDLERVVLVAARVSKSMANMFLGLPIQFTPVYASTGWKQIFFKYKYYCFVYGTLVVVIGNTT